MENHIHEKDILMTEAFQRRIISKAIISQKNSYILILKRKHQVNILVKVSNTNRRKNLVQDDHKDTANRPKSAAEVQNKCVILIKM